MKLHFRRLFVAACVALSAASLSAQVVNKPTVGLELAKKIAAKAEAEAAKLKLTVVVAIVDDGGNLVYLSKMDGTQIGSIDVAQLKAKTALRFKRPSKTFEEAVVAGRNAILSLPDVVPIEGGIPITVNGAIVGAIGISGAKSAEDGVIAEAALAAVQP